MPSEKLSNVRLGVFVILASILLIAGIYFVGSRQSLFGSTFTIRTVFTNAGGLQVGNNVRYAGINVGTVSDITIISDSTIRLDLKLVEKVKPFIKQNAVANLSVDGIVGSALVNITPGDGDAPPVDDGDIIQAANLLGTADLMATLGSTNENIALFAKDLLKISGEIAHGSGTLNLLLQDSMVSWNLKSTLSNLQLTSNYTLQMVQRLNQTVSDLGAQQGLINQLIHDTVIVSNLRQFSSDLNQSVTSKLDSLLDNLLLVGTNLKQTTTNLNLLLEGIQNEQGLVNNLIYDEELSESLKATLKNIEEGSAKFSEDMEALQHNFLLRRYFKKQAKKSSAETSNSGKP